jgi:hypothetical protein
MRDKLLEEIYTELPEDGPTRELQDARHVLGLLFLDSEKLNSLSFSSSSINSDDFGGHDSLHITRRRMGQKEQHGTTKTRQLNEHQRNVQNQDGDAQESETKHAD